MLDAAVRDLGDVNHAFLSGSKLDERAEFLDADDCAVKDLAFLEFRNDSIDILLGKFHALGVIAADGNAAVILDIDLYAGALDDLIDGLSALADNFTDLLRIDLHIVDLGSVLINCLTRLGDSFFHDAVHDELACLFASCDGAFHDRSCETVDLDVHLDRSDTLMRSCYLEVHISEEVLKALDIGKKYEIFILVACDKTAADAGHL